MGRVGSELHQYPLAPIPPEQLRTTWPGARCECFSRADISAPRSATRGLHDYMAWRQRPLKKAGKYSAANNWTPPNKTLSLIMQEPFAHLRAIQPLPGSPHQASVGNPKPEFPAGPAEIQKCIEAERPDPGRPFCRTPFRSRVIMGVAWPRPISIRWTTPAPAVAT